MDALKATGTALDNSSKLISDSRDYLIFSARRAANLLCFSSLYYDRPTERHADLTTNPTGTVTDDTTAWQYPDDPAGYNGENVPNGPQKLVIPSIAAELSAGAQVSYGLDSQAAQLRVQRDSLTKSIEVAEQKRSAAQARADWERVNKDFLQQRTSVAIDAQRSRAQESMRPGGAINYLERLPLVLSRCQVDVVEATARMAAAAKGLDEIYDAAGQLPALPSDNGQFPPQQPVLARAFLEQRIAWTRQALALLSRTYLAEQTVIQPISFRSLLSNADWAQAISQSAWKISIDEQSLAKAYGISIRSVRLRG